MPHLIFFAFPINCATIKYIFRGGINIMSLSIEIPDDILRTAKSPPNRAKQEITKEIAFSLYQRKIISMGNARKLATMDKWAFIEGLAERGIESCRHLKIHWIRHHFRASLLKQHFCPGHVIGGCHQQHPGRCRKHPGHGHSLCCRVHHLVRHPQALW